MSEKGKARQDVMKKLQIATNRIGGVASELREARTPGSPVATICDRREISYPQFLPSKKPKSYPEELGHKSLQNNDLSCSGGGTRTPDTRIMIQRVSGKTPEKNAHSESRAAAGAAIDSENAPIDPDLAAVVDAWPKLPEAIRAGILAMIRTAGEGAEG